jgi:hypothetical protein
MLETRSASGKGIGTKRDETTEEDMLTGVTKTAMGTARLQKDVKTEPGTMRDLQI